MNKSTQQFLMIGGGCALAWLAWREYQRRQEEKDIEGIVGTSTPESYPAVRADPHDYSYVKKYTNEVRKSQFQTPVAYTSGGNPIYLKRPNLPTGVGGKGVEEFIF